MPINLRISALVPVGLIVESVAQRDDSILALGPVSKGRVVFCVDRLRDAFTAGMFVRFRTRRAQAGAYGFGSGYAGIVATPSTVEGQRKGRRKERKAFSYRDSFEHAMNVTVERRCA